MRHAKLARQRVHWRPLARRPTILDRQLEGQPWLKDLGFGLYAVCQGDNCLSCIRGVPLDLPGLNRLLDNLWQHIPSSRR